MKKQPPYENQNAGIRIALRVIGFIILPAGALFAAIGLIDFFSAFGSFHPPTKFWCAFVGLPLIGLGIACLKAGYLRAIGGYVAGETAPVATDTLKYVSDELRPSIRDLARDIRGTDGDHDPVARMKHLEELKTSGLISGSEYSEKRAKILGEI